MEALKSNPSGNTTLDVAMEDRISTQTSLPIGHESKMASVHEEVKRMTRLPKNSTYATHRLQVLNKILQLMTIQRTISQDEELELLFAGLSM